jgi:hypothetical protein
MCKSHTSGVMSFGTGCVCGASKGQKLNAKSSAEAEIVGADDCMPQMLWTPCFLEAQGHKIENNVLCQDNKSSILLETNGGGSSGKRTRHIDVRCFFAANRVKSGQIRIEHRPTGIMIADHFTEALQGALFVKLREMIMGKTDIPLPSNASLIVADPSIGIPDGSTLQESRSVLKDEITKSTNLTVLPAFGSQARKSVSTGTNPMKLVASKRAISWDDVVKRQRDDCDHSFYEILSLTIELNNW